MSQNFVVPDRLFSRPVWTETIDFFDLEDFPGSQENVVFQYKKTLSSIERLAKQKNNYGLIHNDLLEDNLHLHEQSITAFDFEDFCFNWFANDIAVAFFYPVCFGIQDRIKQQEYGKYFLSHFLKGYRKENSISAESLSSVPLFLKIRELDNYSMYFDDPAAKKNLVISQFMNKRQSRIEDCVPVIDLDFSQY